MFGALFAGLAVLGSTSVTIFGGGLAQMWGRPRTKKIPQTLPGPEPGSGPRSRSWDLRHGEPYYSLIEKYKKGGKVQGWGKDVV